MGEPIYEDNKSLDEIMERELRMYEQFGRRSALSGLRTDLTRLYRVDGSGAIYTMTVLDPAGDLHASMSANNPEAQQLISREFIKAIHSPGFRDDICAASAANLWKQKPVKEIVVGTVGLVMLDFGAGPFAIVLGTAVRISVGFIAGRIEEFCRGDNEVLVEQLIRN